MEATWDGEVIGKQQNILCCDYNNCDKHLRAKEKCMSYQCYESPALSNLSVRTLNKIVVQCDKFTAN